MIEGTAAKREIEGYSIEFQRFDG